MRERTGIAGLPDMRSSCIVPDAECHCWLVQQCELPHRRSVLPASLRLHFNLTPALFGNPLKAEEH
jgi:hypothetical protein